jgi:hypothetical protein
LAGWKLSCEQSARFSVSGPIDYMLRRWDPLSAFSTMGGSVVALSSAPNVAPTADHEAKLNAVDPQVWVADFLA